MAQPVVGEMEMHSVANLATLQTPLVTFFPSKKRPNLVSENHRYCRASASRGLALPARARTHTPLSHPPPPPLSLSLCSVSLQRAHTSLSLSLSLRMLSFSSAIGKEEQRFNSVKHRYYVASLI